MARLRAAADMNAGSRVCDGASDSVRARSAANALTAWREQLTAPQQRHVSDAVTAQAYAALWRAEWSRLEGRSDPELWSHAAAEWLRMSRPYPAAYAQWRESEAHVELGKTQRRTAARRSAGQR